MRKLLVMLAGLLFVVYGGVQYSYPADDVKPEYQPKLSRGPAAPAKNGSAAPGKNVHATGTIEPEEVVDVGARVAGTIVSLGADPHSPDKSIGWNSPVERGTVLAQIDSEPYAARADVARAACSGAEAGLAKAKIELKLAETRWKLAKARKDSGHVDEMEFYAVERDYEVAKPSVAVAEATLAQAKAVLKHAEIELGCTTVKSPVKGVVIDRRVNLGQMTGHNETASLFLIASIDKLNIWVSVNEAEISRIHQQQRVRFTVDAFPGKVFEGKVSQIRLNATMTQNVVTYTVVVAISEPEPRSASGGTIPAAAGANERLLPYMTANVTFE